jgi:hypothetical protein
LDAHRTEEAQAALQNIPEEVRKQRSQEVTPLEIRIAAQSGTLESTLTRYQAEPESAPSPDALRSAAQDLQQVGDEASARRVLEFVYTREIEEHILTPANFLGLAEIRLQSGNLAQGVALLDRMAQAADNPFENLSAAADLLVKYGHPSEALDFFSARVKAVPWDTQARLELAKAQIPLQRDLESAQGLLARVAASSEAPYATRAEAAQALTALKPGGANFGSGELDLLAKGGAQDAAAAEQPGYFYARIQAAERLSDPATRVRLVLDAVAIKPQDEPPRISLFRAAEAAGQDQLAYSAIQPLLNQGSAGSDQYPYQAGNTEGTESAEAESDANPFVAQEFLPHVKLGKEEKSAFAAEVAVVLEKLQRLRDATAYWRIALALATPSPSREEFQARLNKVKAELKVEQRDALRRPVVSEHLEQKGTVRPRLLAKTGIAEGSGGGGGGSR